MDDANLMAGSDFCEGYAGVRWAVGRGMFAQFSELANAGALGQRLAACWS